MGNVWLEWRLFYKRIICEYRVDVSDVNMTKIIECSNPNSVPAMLSG